MKRKTMALLLLTAVAFMLAAPGGLVVGIQSDVDIAKAANRLERLIHQEQSIMDEIASMDLGFALPRISFEPPNVISSKFRIALSAEPTEEVIEFILGFTGIPREIAVFERHTRRHLSDIKTIKMMLVELYEESSPESLLRAAEIHFMTWHHNNDLMEIDWSQWYDWYFNTFGYRIEDNILEPRMTEVFTK